MKKSSQILILAVTVIALAGCSVETLPERLEGLEVEVWSQVNGGKLTRKNKLVDFDDDVKLFAVLKSGGRLYSDCPESNEAGSTSPISQLGVDFEYEWYKVETQRSLYCTRGGFEQFLADSALPEKMAWYFFEKLELDTLKYTSTRFFDGPSNAVPDFEPEHSNGLEWNGTSVGTMRFKVVVGFAGGGIESPGEGALESKSYRDRNRVHRISRKAGTGNEILDVGFAHGNLPYYYGSNSPRLEWYGADCGKFVSAVYSRVVDPGFGYLGTGKLIRKPARSVLNGRDGDGVYTWNGRRVEYGRHVLVGDIVVVNPSPHHTGLVGEDANKNGFLDEGDPVLHTGRRAPEYVPIGETSLGTPHKRLKVLKVRH